MFPNFNRTVHRYRRGLLTNDTGLAGTWDDIVNTVGNATGVTTLANTVAAKGAALESALKTILMLSAVSAGAGVWLILRGK